MPYLSNLMTLEEETVKEGCVELLDGTYLYTADAIMEAQEDWDKEDPSKKIDFSTSPFWLQSVGDGVHMEGYETVWEVVQYLWSLNN